VTALAKHRHFLALLAGGLLLRVGLAFVLFPKQGFSTDMQLFAGWATTLARVGPGSFYATATGADYPPGYLYILWLLGNAPASALPLLLKVPAIVADLGIALVLYWAARRWLSERAGLIAAGLYLFIPVTWYDSALWGQVDAVGALLLIASLVLLIERQSEAAVALAILAILVKPQEAIGLVVVLPVLVRRHLILSGSRWRALTSAAAGAAALVLPLVPFDIGGVPGLVRLFQSDADRYSVLTANAFNVWALVGSTPLAQIFGSGGSWTPDSVVVAGGLTAVMLGGIALVAIGLVVAAGLLIRDGRVPILLAFAIVAFAFYAVPTRVHERYLFPFFTAGALLAAEYLAASAGYLVVGALNAINLHAVLGAPLAVSGGVGGFGRGAGTGLVRGGGGFGGVGAQISAIRLPFADIARSETMILLVAVGQTAALVALLVAWCVVVIRPRPINRLADAPYVAWRPSSTS
jgi:Gpi18-like mannosyltransferase